MTALKRIVLGILLLFCFCFILIQGGLTPSGSTISVKTNPNGELVLDSGLNHLEGIRGPSAMYGFLLKDECISINVFSGDAHIMAMPLKTADELRVQFGDFFQCNSPGASVAMGKTASVIFIAANEGVKREIQQAITLMRQSNIPVIFFKGSPIDVKKRTWMGIQEVDHSGTTLFYIEDFKLLKPDYFK